MNSSFNTKVFEKFPLLESERLLFRKITKKDTQSIFQLRSNQKVMKYMDTIVLKDKEEASTLISYFNWEFKHKNGISWGIVDKSENRLIGTFAYWRLIKMHCRAEFGFSLFPEYWGKGYMTETFMALIEFGFQNLFLHSLEANVNPGNTNSIRLLERTGFKKEAYFRENMLYDGKFLDSVIYCLLETDERIYFSV